jgi:hypothetical protein
MNQCFCYDCTLPPKDYFQFKNGASRELLTREEKIATVKGSRFTAWDRSLGAWVHYA